MSKAKAAGLNLSNGSTLYLDNSTYKARQNQLHQTASQLNFSKAPFEMENEVCGTEGMFLLADYWHGVSDSSDYLQSFLTTDVKKINNDVQNSINQTDSKIAGSFSTNERDYIIPAAKAMVAYTPPYVTVTTINNNPGTVFSLEEYLAAFLSVYDVDQETMALAEEWIEAYKAGDPVIIQKMKKYQNLSAQQWDNLSEQELKEFTALTVVYTWSNYVVEQGGESVENYDTYKEICEKMTANLYSFKPITEGYDYVEATPDSALIFAMKTAMESMGMSDSLAFNVATKVENDGNSYIVYDSQYQPNPKDVNVAYSFDESGFVSVNIEDSYVTDYPLHTNQFLATSRDHAANYMNSQREANPGWDSHGMSDDELVGMYQSVMNPNDLQAMTNIAISDKDFMVNGKYAFDIDYWEDDTSHTWNYDRGISDTFSVALGEMGSNMLYRQDTGNYESYINAALQSSINGSRHNIMLDIATGAGVYADTCSMAVINDEADPLGGGNDYPLHMQLNAANANFGVFSQMYEKFDDDTKYTNIDIGHITYSNQTGDINFNITADTDKTNFFFWHDREEGKTITIDSTIESGKEAIDDYVEGKQAQLKKELQRKQEDLVVDTVIDLTGCINPYLKDGIYFVKDSMAEKDVTMDSVNLVKDGIKVACSESKNFNRGIGGAVTIFGAISKYNNMLATYEADKENYNRIEKLELFYNYNTASGTVGLYDYDTIRKIQDWNQNGIVEILGEDCGKTNEQIYQSMYTASGELKNPVLEKIATDLCDQSFDDLNNNPTAEDIATAYGTIEEESGYTKDEINNAIDVLVNGYSENGEYHVVTDIPFELQHACLDSLQEGDSSIDVYYAWETYYQNQ